MRQVESHSVTDASVRKDDMTIGKGTRSTQKLDRTIFSTSRAAEYFRVEELEKLTGQPREKFAEVVLKELKDNAVAPLGASS